MKQSPFVPTRLLRISLTTPNAPVRLVNARQDLGTVTWCALSYVWGGDQPLKLTKSSIDHLKDAIPLEKLPATIRDAVLVSRGLGFEYIWIDCLCIIQDDPEDLTRELATMPSIYQYATVTVAASSAGHVRDGFLQQRGYHYLEIPPIKLNYISTQDNLESVLICDAWDVGPRYDLVISVEH